MEKLQKIYKQQQKNPKKDKHFLASAAFSMITNWKWLECGLLVWQIITFGDVTLLPGKTWYARLQINHKLYMWYSLAG